MKVLASRFWMVTASALLLALGACSSSDSSKNDGPLPPPATTGVLSTGVITGFGSVYLNGERYDTNDVAVTM
ncbi:MAG: hypothetical protein WBY12_07840, partial [Hyphomicrobium sp.]